MRSLLESRSQSAQFTVDYFCRQYALPSARLPPGWGIAALVFSGGIGEKRR